jgi:arabinogalactan oligomer/maltooligosaccharide transport system permease protein
MTTPAVYRRRFRAAFAVATALGLALLFLLAGGSRESSTREESDRTAVAQARALAEVAGAAGGAPENFGPVLERWAKQNPTLRSIRLISLDERSMVASTIAADREAGDLPRRLVREEKPLFDAAQELRAGIDTNREEKVARKPEVLVEQASPSRVRVSAPVFVEGEVSGVVQVESDRAAGAARRTRGWIPVVIFLVALVIFWIVSAAEGEWKVLVAVAAAAIVAGALTTYGEVLIRAFDSEAGASESRVAASLEKAETSARDALKTLRLPDAKIDAARWDRDPLGGERKAVATDAAPVRKTVALVSFLAIGLLLFIGLGAASATGAALRRFRVAYAYVLPALIGMLVLVFFPFFYGIALSFTDQNIYNTSKPLTEIFIGLRNYVEIIGDFGIAKESAGGLVFNYQNFYWTLLFTIVWTVTNVAVGVSVGLLLALILNTRTLAFKPVYRVLLILPWAVPNYITALIWRGMFHQQFGVVNQIIRIFGGEGVAWFETPFTAFITMLATNGWLSFPFMMVISLGALQSISADLYEAARVDGASRWQQFTSITLPSLKPALVPAIILSVVWTFNMFNIAYLVSAGEPAHATEILITQAYKIAFEQYRYGYAAAYSTVIFAILLIYGTWQNRVTRATEGI